MIKSSLFFNRIVSEEEFIKLSKLIEPSYYKEVGINLDIPHAELGQILVQHLLNTSDALMTVFTRWRDKQPQGTDIRALLAEGFNRSHLGSLSSELLAGSLVLTGQVRIRRNSCWLPARRFLLPLIIHCSCRQPTDTVLPLSHLVQIGLLIARQPLSSARSTLLYPLLLNAKQGSNNSHLLTSFGMMQPGFEPTTSRL